MRSGRRGRLPRPSPELLLAVLLVVTGAGAWALMLRPLLRVDPAPLASLPLQIGGWRGEPIPLEDDVTELLRADLNVQRVYAHRMAETIVWLYIGYYGTERGGRPEHTPWVCYPGAGWEIRAADEVEIAPDIGLTANELLVERAGEQRLVHFWYRSLRRTGIHDTIGSITDRMLNRVVNGRADGALVRVSTPIAADGIAGARSRLRAFATSLEDVLPAHWPQEAPERRLRSGDPQRSPASAATPSSASSGASTGTGALARHRNRAGADGPRRRSVDARPSGYSGPAELPRRGFRDA